jgi:hypothetical protein
MSNDHIYTHLLAVPDEELGRLLKLYINETLHNDWEDWTDAERHGAEILLTDFDDTIRQGLLS